MFCEDRRQEVAVAVNLYMLTVRTQSPADITVSERLKSKESCNVRLVPIKWN